MWLLPLAIVTFLYTFGPGMILVRRLRLSRAERFVVSIGVGLFIVHLLTFLIFALRLPQMFFMVTSVVALVMGGLAWRDWRIVLRSHQVRRLAIVWLCILAWGLILLSIIRHFGGGTWGGDWVEHIERTNFFLTSSLPDFSFQQTFLQDMKYPVPMRPPMMNVLTAGVLAQTTDTEQQIFQGYQLLFLFLNSLVFLPCALVIGRTVKLTPRLARKAIWTLAAVFAASPMFCQNLTYAWTKLFAAFYAILAIVIYFRAWRRSAKALTPSPGTPGEGGGEGSDRNAKCGMRNAELNTHSAFSIQHSAFPDYRSKDADAAFEPPRRPWNSAVAFTLAFALLCIGFIVHFSVGPYALFLGLHYLIAVWWRRPNKWREAGIIGGVSVAVLSTWFIWSVAVYGAHTTFTATSAVSDTAKLSPGENAWNILKNVRNTLLPRIVQRPDLIRDLPQEHVSAPIPPGNSAEDAQSIQDLEQPSLGGRVRDFFFLIYQVSLPGGLGLLGWAFAGWLLIRVWLGRAPSVTPIRRFWIGFIPVIFVVGVVVYGGVDRFGVAHICLQPLILLGLCLLAGGIWTLGISLRIAFALAMLLDFSLGVFLQAAMEHRLFPIERGQDAAGRAVISLISGSDIPARAAQHNYGDKVLIDARFWGDQFSDALPLQIVMCAELAMLMALGLLPPRRRRELVRPTSSPAGPADNKSGSSRRKTRPQRGRGK